MAKRRRKRRGRKRKRLVEDGFTNNASVEAIRKLQAHQEDVKDFVQLQQDITTHHAVTAAEKITELFLSNVDDHAESDTVLSILRQYFTSSEVAGNPGHSDRRRLQLGSLTGEKAVLSCKKLKSYVDRKTNKTRRRGCAIVEVASDQVADFFCSASANQKRGVKGINCSPPGRWPRCVGIKKNNRRRPQQAPSDATVQRLDVARVTIMDIDFREAVARRQRLSENKARLLWEAIIDSAGIELKSRAIQLQWQTGLLLAIDLRSIKHVKVLQLRGSARRLALRLRRPPILNTWLGVPSADDSNIDAPTDDLSRREDTAPPRSPDVSSREAFASPTAYVCLEFSSTRGFRAAETALKSFKINIDKHVCPVAMGGSRHEEVCDGISHRLPPTLAPLTPKDLEAVGDSEFGVGFLLDLLLRHGHLRAADVPDVLGMLRCLCQWRQAGSYSAVLGEAAEELPAFYQCNSGDQVYDGVLRMYQSAQHVRQGDSRWRGSAAAQLSGGIEAAREDVAQYMVSSAVSLDGSSESGNSSSDAEEDEAPGEEEEGYVYPRRVIVSPLRVLPYPATPEVSNRILRRYSNFPDRFLRVSFASEWLGSMNALDLSPAVCKRIRTLLLRGLTVGNRRFVFLAFSNSQLREHSCWMYCEDGATAAGAPTADAIRQSIGDLRALRTPAKFAARLGQGFSMTFETFRFQRGDICEIPDVADSSGELFSDGVGVIKREGMRQVARLLPMRMRRNLAGSLPSAIQIRLGGCKGMLALWDGIRAMKRRALVGIRPSMKKFESEDLAVEVCALARPMPAAVNRQLIMALLSLGVDGTVFRRKYEEHVSQLDDLLVGGDEGLEVLRAMGAYAAHSARGVGVSQRSLPACMIEAGISPQEDAFLMSVCQAYRTTALKNVQDKCRMPLADGVNLIGVMDESGTLPPGTFWAQWDGNRLRRHAGAPEAPGVRTLPPGTRTVVSRFPCLAPADIRVLRAADPAKLSPGVTALRNVIVFSQRGTPEPCKMSGGDLDGDIYLLTWDTAILPLREATAVDYTPAVKPTEQATDVTVAQIVDFFIDYMKNDRLGRIANGHLAIADFAVDSEGGRVYADNDKCHELVQLHSTAVDFAKTGVPVDMAAVMRVVGAAPVPDYLGGPDVSETVIGEISRDARQRITAAGGPVQWQGYGAGDWASDVGGADPDMVLAPGLLAPSLEDAEDLLQDWTWEVAKLMRRFGAMDVGQVFSGQVRQFHGLAAGREKQSDHQRQLDAELAKLVEHNQRCWFPDVEPANFGSARGSDIVSLTAPSRAGRGPAASTLQDVEAATRQEMLCAASALYVAAYRQDAGMTINQHLIRRACPWRVAPRLLLELKLAAVKTPQS